MSVSTGNFIFPAQPAAEPRSSRYAAGITPQASEGFHDIKPLPEFSPLPVQMLWLTFLGIMIAALAYWLYRKYTSAPRPALLPPAIPADQAAINEIEALELLRQQGGISVRELCARISLCLRRYLEASLSFPASEQTSSEVLKTLGPALKAAFKSAQKEQLANCFQTVRSLLKFCERITFEKTSEQAFPLESGTITGQITSAKTLVAAVQELLAEEKQRALAKAEKRQEPSSFDGGPEEELLSGDSRGIPRSARPAAGKPRDLTR